MMSCRCCGSYSSGSFSFEFERAIAMRLLDVGTLRAFQSDRVQKIVELLAKLLLLCCSFGDIGFEFGMVGGNAVVLVL